MRPAGVRKDVAPGTVLAANANRCSPCAKRAIRNFGAEYGARRVELVRWYQTATGWRSELARGVHYGGDQTASWRVVDPYEVRVLPRAMWSEAAA